MQGYQEYFTQGAQVVVHRLGILAQTTRSCRRKLLERQQSKTQAAQVRNGMDCGPPKTPSSDQGSPAPGLGRGSSGNTLAVIAERAPDVADTVAQANQVSLTSAALEPLVDGSLATPGGMQATDTDSQEAVEDFEIAQVNSRSLVSDGADQVSSLPTFDHSNPGRLDQRIHRRSADQMHISDVVVSDMGPGNPNSKDGPHEYPSEVHEVRR